MRFVVPLLVAAVLIGSCFFPWMTIETKGITISGVDTTGTDYGRPAYFHFLWTGLAVLFLLINKVWTRRTALVFSAFNVAWAFRNFLVLPICQMGECPVRRTGLYLLFASSIAFFFVGLLVPLNSESKAAPEEPAKEEQASDLKVD